MGTVAEKIYKFIKKVGMDKIKYINSYSANSLSELTNEQIQEIIDYEIVTSGNRSYDRNI